jgi:hypothetical protein
VPPGERFAYAIDIPLRTLAAGAYVLRLEAQAAGVGESVANELGFEVGRP